MDRRLTTSEKSRQVGNHPDRRKRPKEDFRISYRLIGTLGLFFLFMIFAVLTDQTPDRNDLSDYESRGLAPAPTDFKDAVIQVYAARTWGMKGNFAVHTWLAYKEREANNYQVAQVIGWKQQSNGNVLFVENAIADKTWWGNEPVLLMEISGQQAWKLIPKVKAAVDSYPWSKEYVVYPGPNSNTFTSWIGQQVPELQLDLPTTAIGKDWRPLNQSFRDSPSGTGITASLLGLLGIQIGIAEGLELNLLGLHLEADLLDQQVGLPLVGTVSMWWVFLFITLQYGLSITFRRNKLDYLLL